MFCKGNIILPKGKKNDQEASKRQEDGQVNALKSGDPAAQADFYREYRGRLFKAAAYFLGPEDPEVEDVLQETFIRAFAGIGAFEGRSRVFTWLNRICVNQCFQVLRKRQRQAVAAAEDLEEATKKRAMERHAWREEAQEKEDMLKRLRQALVLLPEKCGRIIRLRDMDGQSYAAIARTLKVPMGTVFSRLARCRDALKEMLLSSKEQGA